MSRNLAFTLIEMLIVIVLIGLLSSIVVPRFFDLKADAVRSINLSLYQQFIAGLDRIKIFAVMHAAKGGAFDLNNDNTPDLHFKKGKTYPDGAEYCNGGSCSMLTFETNLWSLNNKKVCYGILEKVIGTGLKVGIVDSMTIYDCIEQGYDVCVTSGTSGSLVECQYALTNSYDETSSTIDWLIYTVDGNTSDSLIGLGKLGYSNPETPWHTLADIAGTPGYGALQNLQFLEQASDSYSINYYRSQVERKFQHYTFLKAGG